MPDDDAMEIYRRLRESSLLDPLGAKKQFLVVLDGDKTVLGAVLTAAEEPGGGRVRSIIARATQGHPSFRRMAPILEQWHRTERDEFARLAIADALSANAPKPKRTQPAKLTTDLPDLARTYDFLASRLRHRVLNALPRAGLTTDRLRDAVADSAEPTRVVQIVDELERTLRSLQKAMDLVADEGDFQPREIDLAAWLQEYAPRFRAGRAGVDITILADERAPAKVHANGYLLETIFRNLWTNCVQTVPGSCLITTRISAGEGVQTVTVFDNGAGFSPADLDRAFKFQYSSSGDPDRGRGHMEVADAISRLGGEAHLKSVEGYGIRVVLRLPGR